MDREDPRSWIRDDIRAMAGYVPGEQQNHAVKLNTNECPWPPSKRVLQALHDVAGDPLRQYPDPLSTRLREAAATCYGLDAAQILAGNGSDDCLTIIYRAILRPGDIVAAPHPTYGLYDTLATLQGARMFHLPYRGADWELPDLRHTGARLVLLANPNNPSGTLIPPAQVLELAGSLNAILVVDEAYIDFADGEASVLPHLDEFPNLIVLRTFSKSYSLAGARLGLLFAHRDLVTEFTKVKDSYNINALTQALGTAALEDVDWHRETVARTVAGRRDLERAFAQHLGWHWPTSQANFLLCAVGERAPALQRHLKARGILVRWWDTPELRRCLRINTGTPEQNEALVAALEALGP